MIRSHRRNILSISISAAIACLASANVSLAATSNATLLLSEFETECEPQQIPSVVFDNTGNLDNFAAGTLTAKSASASPDSAFCRNLNAETVNIDETNGNDPAARDAARADLAAAITPDEIPTLYTSLVQLSADQIRNVNQHLRNQRNSHGNRQDGETVSNSALQNYKGGTAGDAAPMARLSVFASGAQVDGNQNETRYEVGYDLDTDHYTVGIDYRISNEIIAGFAYGNSDTTLEYSEAQNQTDNKTDHYILYTSWYRDNFAVDTLIAYASGQFDTQRNILGSTATGKTDNSLTYMSIAGSYDFVEGGFTYGPFASFDWMDGTIDAFEEANGGGWEVAFSDQDVKSQIYAMGAHVDYAASFNWGVLTPYLRAEWRTELEDDRDFIAGRFVQDPESSFTLTADDPDANWYQLSAGVSAQLPHGIAVFVDYEEVLEYEETDLSTITLGARWEM